jgi:Carboxypeptidase regulatory-like domain
MVTTRRSHYRFRVAPSLTAIVRDLLPPIVLLTLALVGWMPARAIPMPSQNQEKKSYALIFGTVWGPDNRPVYGVKVRIRRADQKKPAWQLYSNHDGEFAQRVPPGRADYVIWADLKGFKSPEYKTLHAGTEVTVHIENDERADTGLHLTN